MEHGPSKRPEDMKEVPRSRNQSGQNEKQDPSTKLLISPTGYSPDV